MVDTILTAIGDVGALAAAGFALLALGKANATINLAESARAHAELAARDAAADRRDAEQDRMRHRVEKVGEILEAVASAAKEPGGGRWQTHRNRLSLALVGLRERLPRCAALVNEVKVPDQVARYIGEARNEVELALNPIAQLVPLTAASQTEETTTDSGARAGSSVDPDLRRRTESHRPDPLH